MEYFLGIDVAAKHLDYCLVDRDAEVVATGGVANSNVGIRRLISKLADASLTCVAFESTGIYGKRLCAELPKRVAMACEFNPKLVRNAALSMTGTKTDSVDARAIAVAARNLMLTSPEVLQRTMLTGEENHELQMWLTEVHRLRKAIARLKLQREQATYSPAESAKLIIRRHDAELKRLEKSKAEAKQKAEELASGEDFDLVSSIKGIGTLTAAVLVARIRNIERFATADQLKAYFGLYPVMRQSGKQQGHAHMARHGNAMVRDLLWNCAKPAAVHNPACRVLYERLRERGKSAPFAWAAVARKLLQIVFGVLKTRTPWSGTIGVPQLAQQVQTPA